jgi:hypothetical protein
MFDEFDSQPSVEVSCHQQVIGNTNAIYAYLCSVCGCVQGICACGFYSLFGAMDVFFLSSVLI